MPSTFPMNTPSTTFMLGADFDPDERDEQRHGEEGNEHGNGLFPPLRSLGLGWLSREPARRSRPRR